MIPSLNPRGAAVALAAGLAATATLADDTRIARGEYLVTIAGCNDCHTPGYFLGKPDMARYLAGSDVGFEIPGQGVFVGSNITPGDETGIGKWTEAQIVAAIRTGQTPEGETLAPIMPWQAFAGFSDEDAMAIAAYLKSIDPVRHAVPGPFAPGEKVKTNLFRILPPGETAAEAPK